MFIAFVEFRVVTSRPDRAEELNGPLVQTESASGGGAYLKGRKKGRKSFFRE